MATSDRDALAEVLAEMEAVSWDFFPAPRMAIDDVADAVLASDWLAQRDRRVRADALREAADNSTEDGGAWDVLALYVSEAGHPYALDGIHRWLRERADRIENYQEDQ
jgi:hypothetical protein